MSKRKGRIFILGWKNSVPYPLKVMRGKKWSKAFPLQSRQFCVWSKVCARKNASDFRTGVIKNNFQAFKILRWPVLASLKIEKKRIKVRYSRQFRQLSRASLKSLSIDYCIALQRKKVWPRIFHYALHPWFKDVVSSHGFFMKPITIKTLINSGFDINPVQNGTRIDSAQVDFRYFIGDVRILLVRPLV